MGPLFTYIPTAGARKARNHPSTPVIKNTTNVSFSDAIPPKFRYRGLEAFVEFVKGTSGDINYDVLFIVEAIRDAHRIPNLVQYSNLHSEDQYEDMEDVDADIEVSDIKFSLGPSSQSPSILKQPMIHRPNPAIASIAITSLPRPSKHIYLKSFSSSSQGIPTKHDVFEHCFGFDKSPSPVP
ncbi:unnamed protein product [Lactuca virosa]|uniref:Uncharacterized protein n=1 Tax=Lactuca virosa TaxID=75947 RepID=A0AAU9PG45_9ASTR|nr:unnamed protein product [Lactuca virosa]